MNYNFGRTLNCGRKPKLNRQKAHFRACDNFSLINTSYTEIAEYIFIMEISIYTGRLKGAAPDIHKNLFSE